MITRIYIDNFRCFSNFEFRPEQMNLLLGRNGSGKTSIVDLVVKILRLVCSGDQVERTFAPDDFTRWDSRLRQRFEIDATLGEDQYRYALVVEADPDRKQTFLAEECVTRRDRTLFRYENGTVHLHRNDGSEGTNFDLRPERSFLSGIDARRETRDLMRFLDYLRTIRAYKLDPTRIVSSSQEENENLRPDGSNFASWYRHISLEYAEGLPALFADLRDAIPFFESLALPGAGKQGRTRELVARMRLPGGDPEGFELDFQLLSDGQRALVILYALILDANSGGGVLFFDEPENYVGLSEIQPWLARLDDTLSESGQLFLISHHPRVIDSLAAEHPFLFKTSPEGPSMVQRAIFDRESGLKASEQVARGLIDDQ